MNRLIVIPVLLVIGLSACGYRFAGAGIELPGSLQRLHVALFENRTQEPYLDSLITESLSYRLAREHNIELVENSDNAEALLSGEIVQYELRASAYDRNDAIESYRVTVKVVAKLLRVADGKVLWQGESIRFDDFISSGVDISAEEGLERATLGRVADRIAEDLSWQMADFGVD